MVELVRLHWRDALEQWCAGPRRLPDCGMLDCEKKWWKHYDVKKLEKLRARKRCPASREVKFPTAPDER